MHVYTVFENSCLYDWHYSFLKPLTKFISDAKTGIFLLGIVLITNLILLDIKLFITFLQMSLAQLYLCGPDPVTWPYNAVRDLRNVLTD